jgi:hypothetical protein
MSLQKFVFVGLAILTLGTLLLAWQLNQAAREVDEVRQALIASSDRTMELFDDIEGLLDEERMII